MRCECSATRRNDAETKVTCLIGSRHRPVVYVYVLQRNLAMDYIFNTRRFEVRPTFDPINPSTDDKVN